MKNETKHLIKALTPWFLLVIAIIVIIGMATSGAPGDGVRFLLGVNPVQAKPVFKYLAKNQPMKIKGLNDWCKISSFVKVKPVKNNKPLNPVNPAVAKKIKKDEEEITVFGKYGAENCSEIALLAKGLKII